MKKQIKIFTNSNYAVTEREVNEFLSNELPDLTNNPEYVKLHVSESERNFTVMLEYLSK